MCGCPSCAPTLGAQPATQAYALTGNRTSDPLVRRLALNPLNHTSQGWVNFFFFYSKWFFINPFQASIFMGAVFPINAYS